MSARTTSQRPVQMAPNTIEHFYLGGSRIAELDSLPESAWISFVVRGGQLVQVTPRTVLRDGDEVLVLGAPVDSELLRAVFHGPGER